MQSCTGYHGCRMPNMLSLVLSNLDCSYDAIHRTFWQGIDGVLAFWYFGKITVKYPEADTTAYLLKSLM